MEWSIVIIAIALSMDSFAVSISNGIGIKNLNFKQALVVALSLAFFQGLMPYLGYLSGKSFDTMIREVDHWVAFALLAFIGIKMIIEGFQTNQNTCEPMPIKPGRIVMQSIATSIDAFAVGISFALIKIDIFHSVLIIGITTFLFSMTGLRMGKWMGNVSVKSRNYGWERIGKSRNYWRYRFNPNRN